MFSVEGRHACYKAEVMENRLYLRTKENWIGIEQFNKYEEQYYLKLNKIWINKVHEEEVLYVWINGNGAAMRVRITKVEAWRRRILSNVWTLLF